MHRSNHWVGSPLRAPEWTLIKLYTSPFLKSCVHVLWYLHLLSLCAQFTGTSSSSINASFICPFLMHYCGGGKSGFKPTSFSPRNPLLVPHHQNNGWNCGSLKENYPRCKFQLRNPPRPSILWLWIMIC